MDRVALQKEIDSIVWYHEFDFGNGLKAVSRTLDAAGHRRIWRAIEGKLDTIEFTGKSVLDVGCWDGYWSFYAERRGAANVLATDDATQNWATGQGIRLAHRLLNSSIEINQRMSVYDVASLDRTFDIILCLGVYYHLLDPFYAFAQIRHCCHESTLVVFEGDATHSLRGDTYFIDFENLTSTCFLPTPDGLQKMLEAAYLSVETREITVGPTKAEGSIATTKQRLKAAWRSREILDSALPATAPPLAFPQLCRMMTFCRPFRGEQKLHKYRPPFGLERYDPRFSRSA